ncbi:hypothetical protein BJX70DRAFT_377873 [Aspergillus crustosus]
MPLSPHFAVSAPRPMVQDLDRPSTGVSNSDSLDYSVHMRSRSTAHAQSPKRLSVFSGRSRSNTTTSTSPSITSSRRSPASSMTSDETAPLPQAHEDRTSSAAGVRHDRHESVTKSLFLRGSRILRRQGSKINIAGTLEEEEDSEREKSRFGRQPKTRPNDAQEQMKRMISDPFDFHHLTHTSPAQFEALGRTRENDLVTEFSVIRASQKPVSNLKGIRAEDLHLRGLSAEDLAHCVEEHDNAGPLTPSPPRSPGARPSSPRQQDYRPLRESRVYENFSRPVSRYPRVDLSSSSPPPASSPRLASSPEIPEPSPRVIDEILGFNTHQTYPEHIYSMDDDRIRGSSPASLNMEGMVESSFGHAITTGPGLGNMDARTVSALTSPTSELDDVPEEDEVTHWHDSPQSQPPVASPSPTSPEPGTNQPSTTVKPKSHLSIHVARELSKKFTEALGSPTLPQYRSDRDTIPNNDPSVQTTLRRKSSVHQKTINETIYESWDDDIDYCYEHAAESNSDFDWARNSLEESRKQEGGVTITVSNRPVAPVLRRAASPSSGHLSTSIVSTPELDPSLARTAPISRSTMTPLSTGYEGELGTKGEGFFQPVSSSALSGALSKHISPDSLYEDYLAADGESDRHFSFCSQGGFQAVEQPVSPRDSFSPISKCNSQESLMLSRAASVARKHRSSVSTTSVPDLVHSLASSRDFSVSDLMLPGEQPGLVRQDSSSHSSHHRQTRSLAREIETQIMSRPDRNDSSDSIKLMGSAAHDRAKSASDAEAVQKAIRPELPAKSAHRRKGRTTSYSLFPSPPLSTPAN